MTRVTGSPAVGLLRRPGVQRAAGLLLGAAVDAALADPARWHPVAGFGRFALLAERALYARRRRSGLLFSAVTLAVPIGVGVAAERSARGRPLARVALTAAATWACLGGTGLAREGEAMTALLQAGDLAGARARLSHLCGRDPSRLRAAELARATVESIAENTSDAVVAPLLWGAVAGVPGLLGYRAVNTVDAMVGYRSPRYLRFGWAAARMDDAANLVPARVTAWLTVALAPSVGGSRSTARATLHRDGRRHPSPNAGPVEAAAAGALGVRLGGVNVYAGHQEARPVLGEGGRPPAVGDIGRSVRLGRQVSAAALALSAAVAVAAGWRAE